MKIAVQGCMHGDLDTVYTTLQHMEKVHNTKIDLLLCCGDFQAVRNEHDLDSLNAPLHYRHMNSFWKYYSGRAIAPYPTIFIGGNHEASNYLWELYYGGWAAPNIYFLGFAGIVKFGKLRIGGVSGIYNSHHFFSGHYERPPYSEATIKSVYHVREYDVHKLMQLEEPIDIFLSHDWPVGVTDCGDWMQLVRDKPYFEKEVRERRLGSEAAALLLQKLKPPYWFSAHLHCKFAARVRHGVNGPVTNFLALDKCGRGREFLQVLDIESEPGPYEIQYDEEWLEITRRFNSVFPLAIASAELKSVHLDKEVGREWVRSKLQARGARPFEFSQTAPSYNPSNKRARPFELSQTTASYNPSNKRARPFEFSQTTPSYNPSKKSDDSDGSFPEKCTRNPQTESLLEFLELPYLLDNMSESLEVSRSPFPSGDTYNSEEIPIDDVDDELEDLSDEEAWEDSMW